MMSGIAPIVFRTRSSTRRGRDTVSAIASLSPAVAKNPRADILGKKVGSSYEANVADALDALGWTYAYQYSVRGGRARRGGFVLDFLVYTRPSKTPIYVNGRYWHAKREEADRIQQANLSRYLNFSVAETIVMWDKDCLTAELAFNFLNQRIGRA